jgi:hypothetical protein
MPRAYVAAVADVTRESGSAAQYLVGNLSGSGALLTDGPLLADGEQLKVTLSIPGCKPITVSAVVTRRLITSGGGASAVSFRDLNLAASTRLRIEVLLGAERKAAPSALIVAGELHVLGALASTIAELGGRPIVTCSVLGAMRWLADPETNINAVLVRSRLLGADGSKLLCALNQEFPEVRRILLHDDQTPTPLHADMAQAIALEPWTRSTLKTALQGYVSERAPNLEKRRIRSGIEPIA